jgi:hypothetical protein
MVNKQFIETASLFPELNRKLIALLKELTAEEWQHETLFPIRRSKTSPEDHILKA